MPPNSSERPDQEDNFLPKITNKRFRCISGIDKSTGEFRKISSINKSNNKRDSCNSCGRRLPSERKLLRSMMKTIGLIIILGVFVLETKHFMIPTIPATMLLATEEFIDDPIPPATTETPPVHNKPVESVGVKGETNSNRDVDSPSIASIPEVSNLPPEVVVPRTLTGSADDHSKEKITNGEGNHEEESSVKDYIPSQTSTAVPVKDILSNLINAKEDNASVDIVENVTLESSSTASGVLRDDSINLTSETKKEYVVGEADELTKKRVDEDPIPSYSEWAQKKQQELVINGGQNGGQLGGSPGGNGVGGNHQTQASSSQNQSNRSTQVPATVTMNAKNFASPDCGAKVIESNPGTQNPSGVLSSSHDEYMLNKCGIPIWFVVQLCEPLTIETIALGNLELFSSSPKEIQLGISDRYPTRDWTKIGPFTLPDARAIHPVVLPSTNSSTFGKYVKVMILSHHGSEHYCPVSVVKVNGKTEYEVLESETGEGDQNKPVDFSVDEEQLEEPSTPLAPEQRSLKDTVLNLINKALQTVVKSGLRLKPSDESDSWMLQSDCVSVTQCIPKSELEQEIYTLLSCNSSGLLPFLAVKSPWCGWDYCHSIFSSSSIGLPWQPEGFYQSIFGGPSVLHALCHYLKPLNDGCSTNSFSLIPNSSLSDSTSSFNGIGSSGESNKSIPTIPESANVDSKEGESLSSGQVSTPIDQSTSENGEAVPPEAVAESNVEQQVESPHQGGNQQTTNFIFQSQETQIPSPGTIGLVPEDPQNLPQSNGIAPQQQQNQQGQQKESVFVRLTNRIKNLERNQSLTASYLEELSKRFKKHNEETVILNEFNKKALNESKVRIRQLDDYYRQELQSLRRNVEDVREKLFNTQLQRSLLIFMCLGQSIFIVIGCCWTRRRLAAFESKLSFSHEERNSNQSSRNLRNSTVSLLGRKRSNSDVTPVSLSQDKPKKLKKKAKKNLQNPQDFKRVADKEIKAEDCPGITRLGRFTLTPAAFSVNSNAIASAAELGITPLYPKENIDPRDSVSNPPRFVAHLASPTSSGLSPSNSLTSRPSSLVTKVDSPFAFQSTWMSSLDSGVSTSGRFALLASPGGPDSPIRTQQQSIETPPTAADTFKRFGNSNRSSVSSTTSFNIGGGATNTTTTTNGHHRQGSSGESSTASSGTNGKKVKKGGLKSFMPKLFDR